MIGSQRNKTKKVQVLCACLALSPLTLFQHPEPTGLLFPQILSLAARRGEKCGNTAPCWC